jgi:3-oxoacyl-[acyl-carrier protein] reductase
MKLMSKTDSKAARKVALVTGAATGIGREVAIRMARAGLAVGINYSKSQTEAEETLALVQAEGGEGILLKGKIGSDTVAREIVARCVAEWGGLDVVVNNAATTHFIGLTDLESANDEVWQDIFSVNVFGGFQVCRAAAPHLKARHGNIVNISSVAAASGVGSSIPYSASKAAVNAVTKSLSKALAPEVRVNAVAPGPVKTRWLKDHQQMIDAAVAQTPLKRAADPGDIADAVMFLALGTTLVTGQIVVVDGGRTLSGV